MKTINEGYELVPLRNLKMHPRNVNQGDFGAIQESIDTNGFFGAVTANKRTGHILAGNHRYKVAKGQHADSLPVIWVDVDEESELRILLADNRTARLGHDDDNALAALLSELALSEGGLSGTGFDGDDLDEIIGRLAGGVGEGGEQPAADGESKYTNKITAPIYEPKGERPPISDLSDKAKTNELCDEIQKAQIPDDVRGFLITAAQRHTVFNFRNIAEFYCHASADVQHLMERSGLIIIDMDKAIANGFVHLSERLGAIADLELSEEDEDA